MPNFEGGHTKLKHKSRCTWQTADKFLGEPKRWPLRQIRKKIITQKTQKAQGKSIVIFY